MHSATQARAPASPFWRAWFASCRSAWIRATISDPKQMDPNDVVVALSFRWDSEEGQKDGGSE